MGKRGPKPTPTSVLKMRGSWLVNNREGEPQASGVPSPPDWLAGEALAKWHDFVPKLVRMGLLGEADADSLAAYCEAWAEFVEAQEYIKEHGRIAISEKGSEYQHPMVGIKNKAVERMNRLGSQFGWTPSARTGLKVEKEAKQDSGKSRFFQA